jgi:cysteine-rich repeat protein
MRHLASLLPLFLAFAPACGARTDIEAFTAFTATDEPRCGDHVIDPGEACDDGNNDSTDACVKGCALARCGDGLVQVGIEACDDGNTNDMDTCRNNCALPTCGDGIIDSLEECDDANADDTDSCTSRCLFARCGDGFVHTGVEACDDGPANKDLPAFMLVQGSLARAVSPVGRQASVVEFYDYKSASAHTGFEDLRGSRLFLYRDLSPGGLLSLVTIHGIDAQASGEVQPSSRVQQEFSGVPAGAFVAVSDDKNELVKPSPTEAMGDWNFDGNSDGGALADLPSPGAFDITVSSSFIKGIDTWDYVDGDSTPISLDRVVTARLLSFEAPSTCRLDCTVPRCGDGILDGGEVCDDGNTTGGDGCAADCRSTN